MKKNQSLPNSKSYDMFFDMREHWDAIVIGAGMGGLTAALIWSRQDGL
jgi:monoamine oxidase